MLLPSTHLESFIEMHSQKLYRLKSCEIQDRFLGFYKHTACLIKLTRMSATAYVLMLFLSVLKKFVTHVQIFLSIKTSERVSSQRTLSSFPDQGLSL